MYFYFCKVLPNPKYHEVEIKSKTYLKYHLFIIKKKQFYKAYGEYMEGDKLYIHKSSINSSSSSCLLQSIDKRFIGRVDECRIYGENGLE